MHYTVTDDERREVLREQVAAIRSSNSAFDAGSYWEAKRLATAVYVLCHDPPTTHKHSNSKSLLGQMGFKNSIRFLSSGYEIGENVVPWTPLVQIYGNSENFRFVPNLEGAKEKWEWMKFSKWWDQDVFRLPNGRKLSRKNLVLTMRSQDGGSHADEEIKNPDYAILRSYNDPRLEWRKQPDKNPVVRFELSRRAHPEASSDWQPIPGAHLATMRQIAFEIEKTIVAYLGDQLQG